MAIRGRQDLQARQDSPKGLQNKPAAYAPESRSVAQGRRVAQSKRRVPSARTASVRLGKSAAIFSITTAPGGTSTSARPRTTAATTAQVTHWVGIAGIESSSS